MPFEFVMPLLYDTMRDGVVSKWFVREGDFVPRGAVFVEVETDKVVMPCELCVDGTLASIHVRTAGRANVGQVVAVFRLLGEPAPSVQHNTAASPPFPTSNPRGRKRPRLRRMLLDRLRRPQL